MGAYQSKNESEKEKMLNMTLLYSSDEIDKRIAEMAEQITNNLNSTHKTNENTNQDIIVVCLLRGGFMFMSDLVKKLPKTNTKIEFLTASSYGDSHESSGKLNIIQDIRENIENKHVIIVDDIIDTGLTMHLIKQHLQTKNPKEIEVCCLLNKSKCRNTDLISTLKIDYCGFECPNEYVVGYGMDSKGYYRNLPYIAYI